MSEMVELYKWDETGILFWRVLELNIRSGYECYGRVGQPEPLMKEMKAGLFSSFEKEATKKMDQLLSEGYRLLDDKDRVTLVIEFNGDETSREGERIKEFKEMIDELLGSVNLGYADDEFELEDIYCTVIDFEMAKKLIEAELQKKNFKQFSRIYNLDLEPDDDEDDDGDVDEIDGFDDADME
jgi:hypothetical protein